MIKIYHSTVDGKINEVSEITDGCWISLINPDLKELEYVAETCNVDFDDLRAPMDEEERSRLVKEDNYTLILVDTPIIEDKNEKSRYVTIPLGIVYTESVIITVCLEQNEVLRFFMEGRGRGFYTFKKTRLILQLLY